MNGKVSIDLILVDQIDEDFSQFLEVMRERGIESRIQRAFCGEELMKYLRNPSDSEHPRFRPCLVIVDIGIPEILDSKVLENIKSDSKLRRIPIVAMGKLDSREEVGDIYDIGVTSYIPKPENKAEFHNMVESLNQYWLGIVHLPSLD